MAVYRPKDLPFAKQATTFEGASSNALNFNKAMYDVARGGYQAAGSNLQKQQGQVLRGYRKLLDASMADIDQMGATRSADIEEGYAKDMGGITRSLIGSGLGNSTVLANMSLGATRNREYNENQLAEQMAGLRLDTRGRIGGAAQGYRGQAASEQLGLAMNQQNWLNSISAPYPDPMQYAQLEAMNAKPEMNPFKIAMMAGGPTPQASGGMMPSSSGGSPVKSAMQQRAMDDLSRQMSQFRPGSAQYQNAQQAMDDIAMGMPTSQASAAYNAWATSKGGAGSASAGAYKGGGGYYDSPGAYKGIGGGTVSPGYDQPIGYGDAGGGKGGGSYYETAGYSKGGGEGYISYDKGG